MSRALRGLVARDLVFIDDRLACVAKERRYSNRWGRFDVSPVDTSQFWSDQDRWQDPVTKWEWANEPGGLEYLAALLREACGLEPIRERRQLEREWSRRTMTGAEIAEAVGEAAAQLAVEWPAIFAYGASVRTDDPDDVRRAVERSNRNDVEQRIWSITLGLPQEELAAVLGVPDVQFTWPKTGTTVNAYRLGSSHRFFVGLIDGRPSWIRTDYPGLILQAKLAAPQPARDHQRADGLHGQIDTVALSELLSGQRRPEIRVMRSNDAEHLVRNSVLKPTVTWSIPVPRNKAHRTVLLVTPHQPAHLACCQAQPLGGLVELQLPVNKPLNTLQPVQFARVLRARRWNGSAGRLAGLLIRARCYHVESTTRLRTWSGRCRGARCQPVYARRRRATASAQRPSAKSAAMGGSGTATGSMIRSNP